MTFARQARWRNIIMPAARHVGTNPWLCRSGGIAERLLRRSDSRRLSSDRNAREPRFRPSRVWIFRPSKSMKLNRCQAGRRCVEIIKRKAKPDCVASWNSFIGCEREVFHGVDMSFVVERSVGPREGRNGPRLVKPDCAFLSVIHHVEVACHRSHLSLAAGEYKTKTLGCYGRSAAARTGCRLDRDVCERNVSRVRKVDPRIAHVTDDDKLRDLHGIWRRILSTQGNLNRPTSEDIEAILRPKPTSARHGLAAGADG